MDAPRNDYRLPPKYKWKIALPTAAILGLLVIATDYSAVSAHGSAELLNLQFFVVIPLLIAFILIFVLVFRILRRQTRRTAFYNLLICTAFVAIIMGSMQIGRHIRTSAFLRLAERSEALVVAIRAYTSQHGRPPDSLYDLVPGYLDLIPNTGMGAYPTYEYQPCKEDECDGNPWKITVFTPSGGINFDMFFYYPLQNYPSLFWGDNGVERIRDWAYVHE